MRNKSLVAVRIPNLLVLVTFGALSLGGCKRSSLFRQEEDFGRSDLVNTEGGSGRPSQRLENWGQPKKRALVLGFWNNTPVQDSGFGSFAADELKRGLQLSQRAIIPTDIKGELSTENFIQGENVRVAQLIREGRKQGVSVLVIGRINKVIFRQKGDDIGIFRQKSSQVGVEVEAKLFDVSTGREVLATSKYGESSISATGSEEEGLEGYHRFKNELTRLGIREAVAMLLPDFLRTIEKMTWQGRVAKIIGQKAYLNSGQASGLNAGDILRVLSPGDDVYDPVSGAYLGQAKGQLKGTLEVVDFIGPDSAVAEIHTGAKPKEGDLVQLY